MKNIGLCSKKIKKRERKNCHMEQNNTKKRNMKLPEKGYKYDPTILINEYK